MEAKTGAVRGAAFRGDPIDIVIDVRSHLEYWLGHLDGAVCIPVNSVAEQLSTRPDVNTGSRILVYCASGARSAAAAARLRAVGYRNVTDGGGMRDATLHFRGA